VISSLLALQQRHIRAGHGTISLWTLQQRQPMLTLQQRHILAGAGTQPLLTLQPRRMLSP
jgi:hypothetical protein